MSKNLGNIPPQAGMTEAQQQAYTNGYNRGRKAIQGEIRAELESHLKSYNVIQWVVLFNQAIILSLLIKELFVDG